MVVVLSYYLSVQESCQQERAGQWCAARMTRRGRGIVPVFRRPSWCTQLLGTCDRGGTSVKTLTRQVPHDDRETRSKGLDIAAPHPSSGVRRTSCHRGASHRGSVAHGRRVATLAAPPAHRDRNRGWPSTSAVSNPSTRRGGIVRGLAISHSWRYKPDVNALHVGNRHLADDAFNLAHLDLRDVEADVLAVRRALWRLVVSVEQFRAIVGADPDELVLRVVDPSGVDANAELGASRLQALILG